VDHSAGYAGFAGQALGALVGFGAVVDTGCAWATRAGLRPRVTDGAIVTSKLARDGRGAAIAACGQLPASCNCDQA
jgi:hypothetical protein